MQTELESSSRRGLHRFVRRLVGLRQHQNTKRHRQLQLDNYRCPSNCANLDWILHSVDTAACQQQLCCFTHDEWRRQWM